MATKTTKVATTEAKPVNWAKNSKLNVTMLPDASAKDCAKSVAETLTRPEVGAAMLIEKLQANTHDVNELVAAMAHQVEAANRGDLSRAEGLLISQAHSLNALFNNLASRATRQEYLKQWEAYMRMALKAQNQCRMTLETLAAIKNPPVVYAKQANINNGGQQQVNNGEAPHAANAAQACASAPGHAANSTSDQTELLEAPQHDIELDTGTTSKAGRADSHLAPVGQVNRAAHR